MLREQKGKMRGSKAGKGKARCYRVWGHSSCWLQGGGVGGGLAASAVTPAAADIRDPTKSSRAGGQNLFQKQTGA